MHKEERASMTLQEKLQEDLKESMRKGDSARRSAIRYLRSVIQDQEIARQTTLDDDAIIQLLVTQAQQRRDSIEAFKKGGRQDLVDKEEAELAIILEYLPAQLSADELTSLAQRATEEVGATGPQDMGKVIGRVMSQVKGRASGREVSEAVSKLLKGLADA